MTMLPRMRRSTDKNMTNRHLIEAAGGIAGLQKEIIELRAELDRLRAAQTLTEEERQIRTLAGKYADEFVRVPTEYLREILAIIDRLAPPDGTQAADAWRAIESAPKDGTRILLGLAETPPTDDDDGVPSISTIGHYEEAEEDGPDSMGHDAGFIDIDFGEFDWGRSIGNPRYFRKPVQPTHWQPLPSPPSQDRSASENRK